MAAFASEVTAVSRSAGTGTGLRESDRVSKTVERVCMQEQISEHVRQMHEQVQNARLCTCMYESMHFSASECMCLSACACHGLSGPVVSVTA